jgi:signal transduction histidine kinase
MTDRFARSSVRCWILVAVSLSLAVPALASVPDAHQEVLVLYATRRDAKIAVLGDGQLPNLLERGLGRRVDYYAEYLDVARVGEEDYQGAVSDFLSRKYRDRRFDLVVAMHPYALTFAAMHRSRLFPNAPIVFFSDSPGTVRPPNSTGVTTGRDLASSVGFALTLQPEVRNVFVVSGADPRDKEFERAARQQLRPFELRVAITYLTGLSIEQLTSRVSRLPPLSVVYYLVVSRDGAGRSRHPLEYLDDIAAASNAPVYSWVDSAMGRGIVGGSLKDQRRQVEAMGELALRVLRGEPADAIPTVAPNLSVPQVDWRQMRQWGISESRLPAGTVVFHREMSLWQRYQGFVAAGLAIVLAQTALITALLLQRSRRRQAEQQVRRNETQLKNSDGRIRALGARLLNAQETERARIARELHDDVSQQLALLAMDLEIMRHADVKRGEHTATHALDRAQSIAKSVHELSHRLYPAKLRLLGIVAAIKGLQRELAPANVPIRFTFDNVPSSLSPELTLCLFRVVQEAVQNAIKYSDARQVTVHLAGGPESLVLFVSDDGIGFDVDAALGTGLGLMSMRERLEAIGGTFRIHSNRGLGTRLDVSVPLYAEQEAAAATGTG